MVYAPIQKPQDSFLYKFKHTCCLWQRVGVMDKFEFIIQPLNSMISKVDNPEELEFKFSSEKCCSVKTEGEHQ